MWKNWCFWTVVLKKTLESPLDSKEIQPVHRKENQPWIFIGRTDIETETPIPWPQMQRLTHLKRPWCWESWKAGGEGVTEDERVDGITNSIDMSFSKLQEMVKDREAWHAAVHGAAKSRTRLSNWTELTLSYICKAIFLSKIYWTVHFLLYVHNEVAADVG